MKKSLILFGCFLFIATLTGCGGSGGGGGITLGNTACLNDATNDSSQNLDGTVNRIHSEDFANIYGTQLLTRKTPAGDDINQDYMLHEPSAGTVNAFLVLIAGGGMDAGITGTPGGMADFARGNFLVRSAHLFANQGYKVLTIDRPDDYLTYNPVGFSPDYDSYRISPEHAVDLSELINLTNTTNLPVIIAGTSRGSISAVHQHALGAMVAISGPLTSGLGSPLTSTDTSPVSEPTQIMWHENDGCGVTTPTNAEALAGTFSDGTAVSLTGGFSASNEPDPCKARTFHGFMGIETCAVTTTTDWIDTTLATLPDTRPTTMAVTDSTTTNVNKDIDLAGAATAQIAGALTYSLPHNTTSLIGSVSIVGTTVTYMPPAGVSGTTDTFVYVVNETGGGTSHNIVSVTIP